MCPPSFSYLQQIAIKPNCFARFWIAARTAAVLLLPMCCAYDGCTCRVKKVIDDFAKKTVI
jgi:hypothetical protein